jgi:hypothetical protein
LGTLVQNGLVLVQKESKNFASFLRKEKKDPANENKRDYAAFAYSIISKVLNLVPGHAHRELDIQTR